MEGKDAGSIVELQKGAIKAGPAVRNNGGGFYNHGMFFEEMTSAGKSSEPSPALSKAINDSFGSFDEMKAKFSDAAAKRFGSGWAWLGVTPDGKVCPGPSAQHVPEELLAPWGRGGAHATYIAEEDSLFSAGPRPGIERREGRMPHERGSNPQMPRHLT